MRSPSRRRASRPPHPEALTQPRSPPPAGAPVQLRRDRGAAGRGVPDDRREALGNSGAGRLIPIAVTVTDAEGCQGTANVTLTVLAPGSAGGAKGTTKGGSSNTTAVGPPNTKISSAKISSRKQKAKFRFKATGSSSGFQCALVKRHRKPKFRKCRSPKTYRHLRASKYTFEVRALSSAGVDPTPAKRRFKIRRA